MCQPQRKPRTRLWLLALLVAFGCGYALGQTVGARRAPTAQVSAVAPR